MSSEDLEAGRRWAEKRFAEIALEFGAPRTLTREDRWRENRVSGKREHRMAYYIEMAGHLTRGEVTFWSVDLEVAGGGETAAREKLGGRMRDVLVSSAGARG
jgi:hypothetical protein